MISIIDYGVGNLRSLQNALSLLGRESQLVASAQEVRSADKIVLPGVGAFDFAVENIRKQGIEAALVETAEAGVPLLGVCLGMQLLFTWSEEGSGRQEGLSLIPGRVKRLNGRLKVPHMGWNEIHLDRSSPLTTGLPPAGHAYFVHSYYCESVDQTSTIATTEYGVAFASIVARKNVFGVQFHPEKSQEIGLQILKNFIEL